MKVGAVYIRVSTDMQIELSPDSQLKMVKQYAKQNDIIISNDYIFADDGISGRTAEKRPNFMRMISVAKTKPKPFDVILVWKFSRFARNREDSIVYKSMLRKECDIEVISVSEPVGEDKTSILIEALLEAMDEYYSINLAEEVRRGMAEKASRGGIVNSPPYGYKMQDGEFVPDEKEETVVKTIFEKYASRVGARAIAEELNNLGIKTKNGKKFENRTIDYILTNTAYIGKIRWNASGKATSGHGYQQTENTIIAQGNYKPIIDEKLFNDVQAVYKENKRKYPKSYNQRKEEYFFRGITRCSSCGATLTQSSNGKSLQCHMYAKGACKVSHSISIIKLKAALIEELTETSQNPNAKMNFEKKTTNQSVSSEYNLITEQIKRENSKLERLAAAYEDGIDTLEEYKMKKRNVTETILSLQDKMSRLSSTQKNNEETDIASFRNKLLDVLETISQPDISPTDFNSALREIISRIVFNRALNSLDLFYKL